MSQENLEIVRAAFDAFERDDVNGFLPLCDPEIEITQTADLLGAPQHEHGHAGVLEALAVGTEQWDDYRIEVIRMTDLGDQVMVNQMSRGRGKDTGFQSRCCLRSCSWSALGRSRSGASSHAKTRPSKPWASYEGAAVRGQR